MMLALAFALAVSAQPGPAPPALLEAEAVDLGELVVIARRDAPDPSDVTTECVWRELPIAEREALAREVGRTSSTLHLEQPHRIDPAAVTEAGVRVALKACGAPAAEAALPFARTAVRFYALERIAADALGARGFSDAKLDAAWNALPSGDRETLAAQAGRVVQGSGERPEAAALIIWRLLRRVRPLNGLNPLAYRKGGANHLVVAHFAPRAVREAMEKRF